MSALRYPISIRLLRKPLIRMGCLRGIHVSVYLGLQLEVLGFILSHIRLLREVTGILIEDYLIYDLLFEEFRSDIVEVTYHRFIVDVVLHDLWLGPSLWLIASRSCIDLWGQHTFYDSLICTILYLAWMLHSFLFLSSSLTSLTAIKRLKSLIFVALTHLILEKHFLLIV